MNDTNFRLYFRRSHEYDNSILKVEIHRKGRWLKSDEFTTEYSTPPRSRIGEMLHETVRLLQPYGLKVNLVRRLLSRKQVHLESESLPLDELAKLGWELIPYPEKFGVVKDPQAMFTNVHQYGVGIDASNCILSLHTRDTRGLALKGIVDKLEDMDLPYFLYFDKSTWVRIERYGYPPFVTYLRSLRRHKACRGIKLPVYGKTADDQITFWADAVGQHQITRDELDEYDTQYDWLLHGAERGEPRIHKFFRKDKHHVSIPNFGLDIEIPERF